MAEFLGSPKVQYFDTATGNPLVGGKLYSYESDFITPKATYPTIADALAQTNANTNPVVLDARGEANVVISGATGLVLKKADGTTVWTAPGPIGTSGNDIYDAAGELLLKFVSAENAVNYFEIENGAATDGPVIRSVGGDTAVDFNIESKGTADISLTSQRMILLTAPNVDTTGNINITTNKALTFFNTANTAGVVFVADSALPSSYILTLPVAQGANKTSMVTNGSGILSFDYSVPTGAVIPFAMATAPTGFLVCDGSAVSRTTYAALFTAISTTFGIGDGSTTFNLPNQARRTVVGKGGSGTGTLANTVGSTGGEETHTLITAEMPAHIHTAGTSNAAYQVGGAGVATLPSGTGFATSSTGGDGAHNNMQPSLVLNYCIKT